MFPKLIFCLWCLLVLVGCHQEGKVVPLKPPSPPATKPSVSPKEEKPKTTPSKPEKEPETEFKRLHYVIYEKGRLKWKINALEAKVYHHREIEMKEIKVSSNPKKGFTISADRGFYYAQKGSFIFEGNVRLKTRSHGILKTSRLVYLPKKELLQTKAMVEIQNDGLIMEGKGFVYDLRTGRFKLLHQTKVLVNG